MNNSGAIGKQRMTPARLLLGLLLALFIVDAGWAILGDYSVDVGACLWPLLLAAALLACSRLYQARWPDPKLEALLVGAGFLCAFSLGMALLNYLVLPHVGARIDGQLAELDRTLGFDWPRAMAWMARHPLINAFAYYAYGAMLPLIVMVVIVLVGSDYRRIYCFCLALATASLICVAVWSLAPSFGAFSVYPPQPAYSRMLLALTPAQGADLVRLLRDGPGLINPVDGRGLIGFPSFHAAVALIAMWQVRDVPILRWPLLVLAAAMVMSAPIQGGHHLVDVLAALPVAVLSVVAGKDLRGAKLLPASVSPDDRLEFLCQAFGEHKKNDLHSASIPFPKSRHGFRRHFTLN